MPKSFVSVLLKEFIYPAGIYFPSKSYQSTASGLGETAVNKINKNPHLYVVIRVGRETQ